MERTFRGYLGCGILSRGFCRVRCPDCAEEYLVAYSCKQRGLCPSCEQKRMVQTAAHLVDHVMPRVPVRQWVLTVPKRLRYHLCRDRGLARAVLDILFRAVDTGLRRASPGAPRSARFGAVSFIHRAGGSLNEHLHYHTIVTDGVFSVNASGEAEFHEAADLGLAAQTRLQEQVRRRVVRLFQRRGWLDADEAESMLDWDHEGGFCLDGSTRIEGWDRAGLEQLARYCARPPFAAGRITQVDEQTLCYRFQRPTPDGRTHEYMSPLTLLRRIAALIPPPRAHLVGYHGVLAPHARIRAQVVATAGPGEALRQQLAKAAEAQGLADAGTEETPRKASRTWAMLIARIYEAMPLLCKRCGSAMRVIAQILDGPTVERILDHLGLGTDPPALSPPARAPAWADDPTIYPDPDPNMIWA